MTDISEHTGLVRDIATRIAPRLLREDCEQAGMVGLWKAAQRFDESRGVRFATFASHHIRGAVIDELRRHQFGSRHHHRPHPVSLDALCDLGITHVSETADPSDHFAAVDFADEFNRLLLVLPIKHWFVVRESVINDRTAVAIAVDLGVTQSRVSQMRSEALRLLRTVAA